MRRRRVRVAAATTGFVLVALALTWGERRGLASWAVDRRLAQAGVPARYRLVAIGPREQVIEDVALGDPARPDLLARRLVLGWRYGLAGPRLATVRAEGVRLRGTWDGQRLSLGALDRLLPQGRAGGTALPDLVVTVRDGAMALRLPAGELGVRLAGAGNLRNGFHGTLRAQAAALTAGSCLADAVVADMALVTADGAPRLTGSVSLNQLACPGLGLRAGSGRVTADVRIGAGFGRIEAVLFPSGFAMAAGGATLGPVRGRITLVAEGGTTVAQGIVTAGPLVAPAGQAAAVAVAGEVRLAAAGPEADVGLRLVGLTAAPSIRRAITGGGESVAGTSLAPLGRRIAGRLEGLLAGGDLLLPVRWSAGRLRIAEGRWRGGRGAAATLDARLARADGGWAGTAELAGEGLPTLVVTAATSRDGWRARLAPIAYRAGDAALATAPLTIAAQGGVARFATAVTITGPLGDGRVEALRLPLAGTIEPGGALRVGEGCVPVGVTRLALAGATIDDARLSLCGYPLFARDAAGRTRVQAVATGVQLHGHSGSAPLALAVERLSLGNAGYALDGLAVHLGEGEDPTRLTVAHLAGAADAAGLGGRFDGAAGAIARVPLALSGASGAWRLGGGTLRLAGALQVADRGAPARFHPLASDDVALTLADGRIAAQGSLHLPGRSERIADVALTHDLAGGTGRATFAVPGLTFARRGFQPDMLTPLTLGVVANVAGTVRGAGEIGWSAAGTTSSGRFATDRLDLAAAFGPVTGIAGTLTFTDLLGLVSAPHQELRIAEVNPGIAVANGSAHYRLLPGTLVQVEEARWPFAGGTLTLQPTTLDFAGTAERRLTFAVDGLDAAAFLQQLDLPNISATGTFDGRLPMVFDAGGGRIEDGGLASRGSGTLAYVGELTTARLGTMGKLAFDALKAIRYNRLDVRLGGRLDGEMVSLVRFDGVRQATGEKGLVARAIHNLPFRFNIAVRAPFRGLVGSARSYADPSLLLRSGAGGIAVQPAESGTMR